LQKFWRPQVIYVTFVHCLVYKLHMRIFVPLWTRFRSGYSRRFRQTFNSKKINGTLSRLATPKPGCTRTLIWVLGKWTKRFPLSSPVPANKNFLQLQENLRKCICYIGISRTTWIEALLVITNKLTKKRKFEKLLLVKGSSRGTKHHRKNKMSAWTNIFLSLW